MVGPQLEIKICTLGTVINRIAYPADYCHLEGAGRQSQPMPIRWMAWESVLMVSDSDSSSCSQVWLVGEEGGCSFQSQSRVEAFRMMTLKAVVYLGIVRIVYGS